MCGIAGIFGINGSPVGFDEVNAMCNVLEHRGPNDEGYYINGNIGLGMRRLSIVDLATGHQPVNNEDGTVHVVMNGEIYNFRELRQELEAQGHVFYTETDTEVIVHLIEEAYEGNLEDAVREALRQVEGAYGLAIITTHEPRKLVAARAPRTSHSRSWRPSPMRCRSTSPSVGRNRYPSATVRVWPSG